MRHSFPRHLQSSHSLLIHVIDCSSIVSQNGRLVFYRESRGSESIDQSRRELHGKISASGASRFCRVRLPYGARGFRGGIETFSKRKAMVR